MLTIVNAVEPVFCSVTACEALEVFCVTPPKASDAGRAVTVGNGVIVIFPVPLIFPVPVTVPCPCVEKAQAKTATSRNVRLNFAPPYDESELQRLRLA